MYADRNLDYVVFTRSFTFVFGTEHEACLASDTVSDSGLV